MKYKFTNDSWVTCLACGPKCEDCGLDMLKKGTFFFKREGVCHCGSEFSVKENKFMGRYSANLHPYIIEEIKKLDGPAAKILLLIVRLHGPFNPNFLLSKHERFDWETDEEWDEVPNISYCQACSHGALYKKDYQVYPCFTIRNIYKAVSEPSLIEDLP